MPQMPQPSRPEMDQHAIQKLGFSMLHATHASLSEQSFLWVPEFWDGGPTKVLSPPVSHSHIANLTPSEPSTKDHQGDPEDFNNGRCDCITLLEPACVKQVTKLSDSSTMAFDNVAHLAAKGTPCSASERKNTRANLSASLNVTYYA